MTKHALCIMYFKDGYEEWHKPIPEGESFLGRGAECHFVVDNEKISRQHLKFVREGDSIYLENVSSFGIVEVNGESREHCEIGINDKIAFEDMEFIVKDIPIEEELPEVEESLPESSLPADSSVPEVSLDALEGVGGTAVAVQEQEQEQEQEAFQEFSATGDGVPFDSSSVPAMEEDPEGRTQVLDSMSFGKLVVLAGPDTGKEFPVSKDEIIVGRSPQCDIVIEDDSLSRKHSKIIHSNGTYRIVDLESSNGTRVNGIRVIEQALKSFDTVQIGDTEFRFVLVHRDWEEGAVEGQFDSDQDQALALGGSLESVEAGELEQFGFVEENALKAEIDSKGPPVPPGIKGRLHLADRKWNSFSKPKKLLYILLALVVLVSIKSMTTEKKEEPKQIVEVKKAPLNKDIPPEFFELTEDVRLEIERAYNTAVAAYQQQNWVEVIKSANFIKTRVPFYKEIDKLLPIAKQKQNALDEAEYEKIPEEEASEKSGDLYYYLAEGDAALAKRQWQAARDNYEKALEIDPTNYEALRGREAARATRSDKDWKEKQRAQEAKVDERIIGRITEARLVIDAGKYDQGISLLEKIIRNSKPNDPSILMNAKEWLEHARKERVAQWEPDLSEGEQLIRQGRFEDAFRVCNKVSEMLPEQKRPKRCMKVAVMKLEHRARKIYRNALIEEYLGNQRVAKDLYERIVQSFPDQLDYHRRARKKLRRYDPED